MTDTDDLWQQICEIEVLSDNWYLLTEGTRKSIVKDHVRELKDIHSEMETND